MRFFEILRRCYGRLGVYRGHGKQGLLLISSSQTQEALILPNKKTPSNSKQFIMSFDIPKTRKIWKLKAYAAQKLNINDVFELAEEPIPELKDGEVLLRVDVSISTE